MEDLLTYGQEYVNEGSLVLIPVLLILGALIKKINKIPDEIIPITLLVIGLILSIASLGFNVEAVVQGILVTGAAVLGNQTYKQVKKVNKK